MNIAACRRCGQPVDRSATRCIACGAVITPDELTDTMTSEWFAGAIVARRYRLERLLGAGGMGVVWAATHMVTRKQVALKFLRDPAMSADARRRFLREAKAASATRHPNVIDVYDVFELDDSRPVMVMELLSGQSLADELRQQTRLSLIETISILLPVISAVGAAHAQGIVHRDLKPANIFLIHGSATNVKVLDFGVAKFTATEGDAAQSSDMTQSGQRIGTPCYMSPEQVFGERDIDHCADIWALGLIIYECLSGVLPTRAENAGQVFKIILTGAIPPIIELVPDVPDDLAALVSRMLSLRRHERPANLIDVWHILSAHIGTPVPTVGQPSVLPTRTEPRRNLRGLHHDPGRPNGRLSTHEAFHTEAMGTLVQARGLVHRPSPSPGVVIILIASFVVVGLIGFIVVALIMSYIP